MEPMDNDKNLRKTIIVGDENTGKSCYFSRLVYPREPFSANYESTIGYVYGVRKHVLVDDIWYLLRFLDTSGHSNFRHLIALYFRGARGFIVVYSVTDKSSFENIDYWLQLIRDHCDCSVPIMLVGTKCDLEDQRQVSYEMAKDFADERGVVLFEVSNKNGCNVELSFLTLAVVIRQSQDTPTDTKSVHTLNDINRGQQSCQLL